MMVSHPSQKPGQPFLVPTATGYALAAAVSDHLALEAIFKIKKRPASQPLLLLVKDLDSALKYCHESLKSRLTLFALALWPGSATLVVAGHSSLPKEVLSETGEVALRWDPDETLQGFLDSQIDGYSGTSANLSGQETRDTPQAILKQLGVALGFLDGGPRPAGASSTLVNVKKKGFQILRQGKVDIQNLPGLEEVQMVSSQDGVTLVLPGVLLEFSLSNQGAFNVLNFRKQGDAPSWCLRLGLRGLLKKASDLGITYLQIPPHLLELYQQNFLTDPVVKAVNVGPII